MNGTNGADGINGTDGTTVVVGSTIFDYTNSSVMSNVKKGYGGNVMTSYNGGGQAHSHGDTGLAGGATINVVQPYMSCHIWKRTS